MKREYSFNARLQCVTDFGNVLCLGRVITKSGVADQLLAGPNRINNLGKIWGQRNHSINLCRQRYFSSCVVDYLSRLTLEFGWALSSTAQQTDNGAQENQSANDQCCFDVM